jgi:hypothetical protein
MVDVYFREIAELSITLQLSPSLSSLKGLLRAGVRSCSTRIGGTPNSEGVPFDSFLIFALSGGIKN